MTHKKIFVIVDPTKDNVAVSRVDLPQGTVLSIGRRSIVTEQAIKKGQRFALAPIDDGEPVIQYGAPFGTSKGIPTGGLIHSENVAEIAFNLDTFLGCNPPDSPPQAPWDSKTFFGFMRADGRVGVRNHYIIVPTSQCASQVAWQVVEQARATFRLEQHFPNVDSVVALANTEGCGCASNIQIDRFLRILRHYLNHPNVGGALIIDLGCEQTNYQALHTHLQNHSETPKIPLDWLTIQKEGGVRQTLEKARTIVGQRLPEVNNISRSPQPARHLLIGTECGASDSFSGITANPIIGNAVDKTVAAGGSAILAEVPEMMGAERMLMERMRNENVVSDFKKMVLWYRDLARGLGINMADNLVPENRAGGLINACIKSLGAVAKGGTTAIEGIVDYGEYLTKPGLHLSQGPGNDMESVTGLVASGANIVCFSTGKGTITGNAIAPVIKVSSTTHLYQSMSSDIDYNAGVWLDDPTLDLEQMGEALFEQILATASGQKTCSELNGQQQFQVWTAGKLSL